LRADIFSKLPPLIQCFAHGIIRQESNFSESAVSTAKAKGLMQLMDGTANAMRKLAPRYGLNRVSGGIHDRRVNVTLGTTHLLEHLEKYNGYVVLAIAAYNAGYSNANKWIKMFVSQRIICFLPMIFV
jgi:soluble lytic murein transglycosylase